MSKKKTNIETSEDGQQNGPAPVATGDAPVSEGAPPSSLDSAPPEPDSETAFVPENAAETSDPSPNLTPPPLPSDPPPLPTATAPDPPPPAETPTMLPLTQPVAGPLPLPPPPPPVIPVATASHYDLNLAPVAQVAPPPAPLVVTTTDPALEERLRRLEALLMQAQQNLQAAEQQRITERMQTTAEKGPSMLGQAKALFDVGRHLLPSLPGGQPPPRPRGWLIWEMLAEFRAIFCMYLDPRYRLPWYGYVVPPILLVAYVTSLYWVPFAHTLGDVKLSWVLTMPVDLLLLYCTFKILGHEARRYRETAPDLPPSLRLNRDEPRQQ